jgi:hypothetical protein
VTGFEIAYLCFGSFIVLAGLIMIATYSLTNRWWQTHVGRMMVTYAAAEVLMSLLLTVTIVLHLHPIWFRGAWFVLQLIVGATFCYQTAAIVKLHRQRMTHEEDRYGDSVERP